VSPVAATVLYLPGHYNVLYESWVVCWGAHSDVYMSLLLGYSYKWNDGCWLMYMSKADIFIDFMLCYSRVAACLFVKSTKQHILGAPLA
jgi:hypothetical protein